MTSSNNYSIKRLDTTDLGQLSTLITNNIQLEIFESVYLHGLNNYIAYGAFENDKLSSVVAYYVSGSDPSWYLTNVLYSSPSSIKSNLDYCINNNEGNNLFKFYTLVNQKEAISKQQNIFSDTQLDRYDCFDECILPAKTKSFYTNIFEILQKRTLLDESYIVRCYFLKQIHRKTLAIGGDI